MTDPKTPEPRKTAFVVLAIISATLVGVIGYGFGQVSGYQEGYGVEATQRHYQDASADARESCQLVEPARMLDCVYDAVEASKESQDSEQDLAAQKGMHFWAIAMAIAAFLQTGVAGYALWFLREDLRQNRKSMEVQNRAYILTVSVVLTNMEVGNRPHVALIFQNGGPTFAQKVKVDLFFNLFPVDVDEKFLIPTHVEGTSEGPIAPNSSFTGDFDMPREMDQKLMDAYLSGEADLICFGRIKYETFGEMKETSFRFFSSAAKPDADGNFVLLTASEGNAAT